MNTKTNHGTLIDLPEAQKRTAPVGSGAPSGFAAAERSANQTRCGGEERSDELESLAVSPVKAKAAIVFARGALFRKAAEHDTRGDHLYETGRDELGEIEEEMAALCRQHAETLWSLLPEPESEQPSQLPIVPQPTPAGY